MTKDRPARPVVERTTSDEQLERIEAKMDELARLVDLHLQRRTPSVADDQRRNLR